MFYAFGKFICKVFIYLCFPLTIKGRENIPVRGGFIVASNHASYLDPVVLGIACPRPLNFMAKDTLFKNPLFGWILKSVNTFPLKRKSADFGAIKEALRRLENGRGLLLFPEGTRTSEAEIKGGLSGVGFLARKSRVPVVPAFVKGTEKAMPKSSRKIYRAPLGVIFGPPMDFHEIDGLSDADKTQKIMEQICSLKISAGF